MSDSVLGRFHDALKLQLERDLQIPLVDGLPKKGIEGRDLGGLLVGRTQEVPGHVMDEELFAVIRVYRSFQQQMNLEEPIDPHPFYELVDLLKASVRGHQTGLPGSWFQRLTQAEIDMDAQSVDALIVARTANTAL